MNIYQRINAVMAKVKYVQHDVTVSGGGSYKATSHDMVLAVLRPEMVANGIVTRVEFVEGKITQFRDLKEDIKMHMYEASYIVDFVNMDDPQDFMRTCVPAHAADNGDKAPGKATSYAVKYAMLKTFGLETGENEESRIAEPMTATDIQKDEFEAIIEANNDPLGMLAFAATVGPEVMNTLNGSFKPGAISEGKATLKKLTREGWIIIKDYAAQIEDRVNQSDSHGLLELASELTQIEKRLLMPLLTESQVKALVDVKKLAA
jgi:hypothetical protein